MLIAICQLDLPPLPCGFDGAIHPALLAGGAVGGAAFPACPELEDPVPAPVPPPGPVVGDILFLKYGGELGTWGWGGER